jgi:hypothetical protein
MLMRDKLALPRDNTVHVAFDYKYILIANSRS